VARGGGFWTGQAVLGVWVILGHMPAIGAASRPAVGMRVPRDHVAQHFHRTAAAAFRHDRCGIRVSR